MDKLKPCPFCNGNPIPIYNATRHGANGRVVTGTSIACTNCNVMMFYPNTRLAEQAWNRRAKPKGKKNGEDNKNSRRSKEDTSNRKESTRSDHAVS